MNTQKKALVIGAGGAGHLFIPAIAQSYTITVADGDVFEDKNKTRQTLAITGENKAKVMSDVFGQNKKIEAIPKYLHGGENISTDLIFSCVDSNEGRSAARRIALRTNSPAIIMQNEAWNPMAFLFLPEFDGTDLCPYVRYNLENLDSNRNFECGGITVDEDEGGQSGIANLAAAGLGATILHSIQQKNQDNWILEAKSIPWPTWKKIKDVRKEVVESAT
jgi:hypothetical protein